MDRKALTDKPRKEPKIWDLLGHRRLPWAISEPCVSPALAELGLGFSWKLSETLRYADIRWALARDCYVTGL